MEAGPFTIFVGTGPWPYYARPRLGLSHTFTRDDVAAARERLRELGQPENFEWVHETTPSLLGVIDAEVLKAPLMALDRALWRPPDSPARVRILDADDEALGAARAVQDVGFARGGTVRRARGHPRARRGDQARPRLPALRACAGG